MSLSSSAANAAKRLRSFLHTGWILYTILFLLITLLGYVAITKSGSIPLRHALRATFLRTVAANSATPTSVYLNCNSGTPVQNVLGVSDDGSSICALGISQLTVFPGMIQPFVGTNPPVGYLMCDGATYTLTNYIVTGVSPSTTLVPESSANLAALMANMPAVSSTGSYGTMTGYANGTGSVVMPNLNGKIVLGAGTGAASGTPYALGNVVGAEAVALTVDQLAPHTHVIPDHVHWMTQNHDTVAYPPKGSYGANYNTYTCAGCNASHSLLDIDGNMTISYNNYNNATTFSVAGTWDAGNTKINISNVLPITSATGASTPVDVRQPSMALTYLIKY